MYFLHSKNFQLGAVVIYFIYVPDSRFQKAAVWLVMLAVGLGIRNQLCWLTGSLLTDRAVHPVCLRQCMAVLFSFRQDYSKESNKVSTGGIIEQQQRD